VPIVAPEEKPKARPPEYTLYRSRRRATAPPDEEPKRRSLVDLIVRAGAVAAAIGSIVAVVALVWPDSPEREVAKLSNVSHERNVTLADFTARQEIAALNPRDASGPPAEKLRGTGPPGLAVVVLASTEAPDGSGAATTPDGDDDTTTGGEDDTTTGGEDDTATGGEGEDSTDSHGSTTDSGEAARRAEAEKLEDEANADFDCGGPCGDDDEVLGGGASGGGGEQASGGGTEALQSARRLLRVFRNTRVRNASASAPQDVLGVTVSFDLQLEGFKGRRSYVRWSLYDARADRRVPRDWLINRRVLSMRGKANSDRASKEFWVPLPRRQGPFFVRVSAYDDQGTRLTYEDTKAFR